MKPIKVRASAVTPASTQNVFTVLNVVEVNEDTGKNESIGMILQEGGGDPPRNDG